MIEILKTGPTDNYSVRRGVFYSPETTQWMSDKLKNVPVAFRGRYKTFLYEWHRHFPEGLRSVRDGIELQAAAYAKEPCVDDELRARRLSAYCDLVEYILQQTAVVGFPKLDYGFSSFLDQYLDTKYGVSVTEPKYLVAMSVYLSDLCWQLGVDRRKFLHRYVEGYRTAKRTNDTNKIWSHQATLPSIAIAVQALMHDRPDDGKFDEPLRQSDLVIDGITSDHHVRYNHQRSSTNSVRIADVEASRTAVRVAAQFFGRVPQTNLFKTVEQILSNKEGFGKLFPESVGEKSTLPHRRRVSLGLGVEYQSLLLLFSSSI